jgi:L-ornithine N5-oxygenase
MTPTVYDAIGVGFGPANLAVAIAIDDVGVKATTRYFERNAEFAWQPAMMLQGSDIQHHPLRDLITPVNPRSYYSFVNYLHQSERYFEFLNLGIPFPLRRDFAAYVEWAASFFTDAVTYETEIESIEIVEHRTEGEAVRVAQPDGTVHHARNVVIGPGRSRNIPDVFKPHLGARVFHLMDYLPRIEALSNPGRIAVIGGSQSAVEILLDLDRRFPGARITGITRRFGYRLKDTSPFTGEVFFPDFIDYYHNATWQSRQELAAELRETNYASVDGDVLNQLYLRQYESKLEGTPQHLNTIGSTVVESVRDRAGEIELCLRDRHSGQRTAERFDAVVLATGFLDFGTGKQRELTHPLLKDLTDRYAFDSRNGFEVGRDYALIGPPGAPGVYLNGLCESTHGFGDAGSFSLLSLRANAIARSLYARLDRARVPEPAALHAFT